MGTVNNRAHANILESSVMYLGKHKQSVQKHECNILHFAFHFNCEFLFEQETVVKPSKLPKQGDQIGQMSGTSQGE